MCTADKIVFFGYIADNTKMINRKRSTHTTHNRNTYQKNSGIHNMEIKF